MLTRREELWANVRGMGLVAASSPLLTLVLLGLTGVQGVAPALVVAETGRFLAGLPQAIRLGPGSSAAADVRGALVLMAGAILVSQVFGPVQEAVLFGLQRRFEAYLARRLMAAALALPGLAYFEDPAFRDDMEVSNWISWGPVHTLSFLAQAFQQVAQVAAMAAVAATFA